MSLSSQQYADLADHCYDRDGRLKDLVNKEVLIGGEKYTVLEYADNPRTGYQGAIYQRLDTGDIVVAHRGTEPGREPLQDIALADAGMVLTRSNLQAPDAIELTRRALELAKIRAPFYGNHIPEVTTTGHSLGGTLAQITAHHFDLRGETFNAYGAVSLDRGVPEGGERVINHVMAADAVSSASAHYGQVQLYATPREIATLRAAGYHDPRLLDWLTPDQPVAAAIASLGSHDMHHFLEVDGDHRRDRSVLLDPQARRLAGEHQRMIEDYRGDVRTVRSVAAAGLRGPGGLVQDTIESLRGPRPAGEPAAREAAPAERRSDAAEATSRLERLLSGQVDPAARAAWDRDVAAQRSAAEAPLGRDAAAPPSIPPEPAPAGWAR
jgi:hypothetical protein